VKIVLLGTGGGPRPTRVRFPSSQAIIVDDQMVVIDCGNGVVKQLTEAKLSARDMTHLLVTHHHVDHTADLGYLPVASWIQGRSDTINVYGPPPTSTALSSILDGYEEDLVNRAKSTGRPPFRPMVKITDINSPGLVLDEGGMQISCAFVDHPPFEIALAYRIDAGGKSVVVSGDTAPSQNLIDLAAGADVLIHEVVHPRALADMQINSNAATIVDHMRRNHTMVEDLGIIAEAAKVKTLVLSHLVPHEGVSTEEWIQAVKPTFSGEVIVGEDLMELTI
jgi:ribonuclease BN (tRNA processing enzyme)